MAIDGAQGTGKTTLLEGLRHSLSETFGFVEEASRKIAPDFGVFDARDWPRLLSDKALLEQFFSAEEAWTAAEEERCIESITDSSLWLVAAYRNVFGCTVDVATPAKRCYSLLLHCPPLPDLESDGFRFQEGQSDVNDSYVTLTRTHFRGVTRTLPTDSSRLDSAIAAILAAHRDWSKNEAVRG